MNDNNHLFFVGTKIYFGQKCSYMLIDIVLKENWKKIGLIVDSVVLKSKIIQNIINDLKESKVQLVIEAYNGPEPTYHYLQNVRSKFMGIKLEAMIGIGGGSVLDIAKGIAVLVYNKKNAIDYRGFPKLNNKVLPIICMPTTAGTGSEITPNASFIDTEEEKKLGINGEFVRPKYAFLDPELTISCPERPSISAGVDALVHAHDSFLSKKSTSLSKVFSMEGFKKVYTHLSDVVRNPNNVDSRSEVLYGAMLAAIGMIHGGGGPTSVMSYPLGVYYNVPHGIAGGIFLPEVIEYNINNGYLGYSIFYDSVLSNGTQMTKEEKSWFFLDHLKNNWIELNIPKDITEYGYTINGEKKFIQTCMNAKAGLDTNPVKFDDLSIQSILSNLTPN